MRREDIKHLSCLHKYQEMNFVREEYFASLPRLAIEPSKVKIQIEIQAIGGESVTSSYHIASVKMKKAP